MGSRCAGIRSTVCRGAPHRWPLRRGLYGPCVGVRASLPCQDRLHQGPECPSVTRYGLRTAPNSVLMSLIKKQTQNPVTFTGLLTGEGRFWSRTVFSGIRFLSCLGSFAGSLSHLGGGFSLLRRPPSSSVLRGRDEQCSNPPGCNL